MQQPQPAARVRAGACSDTMQQLAPRCRCASGPRTRAHQQRQAAACETGRRPTTCPEPGCAAFGAPALPARQGEAEARRHAARPDNASSCWRALLP